jgi:hypothetical protein
MNVDTERFPVLMPWRKRGTNKLKRSMLYSRKTLLVSGQSATCHDLKERIRFLLRHDRDVDPLWDSTVSPKKTDCLIDGARARLNGAFPRMAFWKHALIWVERTSIVRIANKETNAEVMRQRFSHIF